MEQKVPRLVLAGTNSGCGKTTVTCAVLQALVTRGLRVGAAKCGPDYIDPMFHSRVIGAKSSNLDSFFFDRDTMRYLLAHNGEGCDITVIEGVMGYYDGLGLTSTRASTYEAARETESPVVLVVNARGAALSVLAAVEGFLHFAPDSGIRGVILNGCSAMSYGPLSRELENRLGVRACGYLPRLPECALESRHLGLITADEVADLQEKLRKLAAEAEKTLDIPTLLEIAHNAPVLDFTPPVLPEKGAPVRIGVARDRAFCFYYAENLDLLQSFGAELVPFSPIHDTKLPDDLDGIYLGGGYPELHLKELSHNQSFLHDLRCHAASGIPIFAECGGFLYLQQELCDADGQAYPMAQLLDGTAHMGKCLCRFGYVTLTAQQDTLLGPSGTKIRAHEFHYADSTENGNTFLVTRPNGRTWQAYQSHGNILGGFPHLYFPSNPKVPANFAGKCRQFREEKKRL